MFDLRDEDIPKTYGYSMANGAVNRAFKNGFETCRDKFLKPIEETGMRRCPFCENDYIKIEMETYTRNDRLFGEAKGVCGVCYSSGPTVLMDFTGRDKDEVHAKIEDDAKSLWNEINPAGSKS